LAVICPSTARDATSLKEAFVTATPISSSQPQVGISTEALSKTRVAVLLGTTVVLALLVYYFIGIDEGMVSVFGKSLVVHEWVHDSRHLLGFPCH
jgi:cobalt transporter subunit CbtB